MKIKWLRDWAKIEELKKTGKSPEGLIAFCSKDKTSVKMFDS